MRAWSGYDPVMMEVGEIAPPHSSWGMICHLHYQGSDAILHGNQILFFGSATDGDHIPGRLKHTTFGSVISCRENLRPSRPRPEYLMPPNGIESKR